MTDDLVAWLRERVDEDERKARAATPGSWRWTDPGLRTTKLALVGDGDSTVLLAANADVYPSAGDAEHIANFDPARALAEVAAKRLLMERHTLKAGEHGARGICAECGGSDWKLDGDVLHPFPWVMPWPCPTLRALALPYAGRPGFREEWR